MSELADDPRGSPEAPRCTWVNAPVGTAGFRLESACSKTPTSARGVVVVAWYGVVKALYTTQTSLPSGEIAGAVNRPRSPADSIARGGAHVRPPVVDSVKVTCGCANVPVT